MKKNSGICAAFRERQEQKYRIDCKKKELYLEA